jgi:alkanesulfonate monooxygenase SsuD/methylene tetrahydromethanopterin reductase-like flavin-dependent oxidoreductase (luciferase family)
MGRTLPIGQVVPHVQLAETLGYEHATFIDSQALSRDCVAMMTLAAEHTSRVRIGPGVTQPYTRHMSVLANAVATVDELSGGRAMLGIGAGMSSTGVLGKQPRPLAELAKAVDFFRDFVAGKEASWQGGEVRSEWSRRQIPVLIGADGPKGMRQAARIADGVFLPGVRPDLFRWRLPRLREGAAAAGRRLEDLDVWTRTMVCVDDDLGRAREEVRSYAATCAFSLYLGVLRWPTPDAQELRDVLPGPLVDEIDRLGKRYDYYQHEKRGAVHAADLSDAVIDSFVFCGPPARVIERIQELRGAGVDRISMVLYALSDKKAAMQRFAEDVLPHVA